jgi:hypothetical protein
LQPPHARLLPLSPLSSKCVTHSLWHSIDPRIR